MTSQTMSVEKRAHLVGIALAVRHCAIVRGRNRPGQRQQQRCNGEALNGFHATAGGSEETVRREPHYYGTDPTRLHYHPAIIGESPSAEEMEAVVLGRWPPLPVAVGGRVASGRRA